jgi:hypothetical protein
MFRALSLSSVGHHGFYVLLPSEVVRAASCANWDSIVWQASLSASLVVFTLTVIIFKSLRSWWLRRLSSRMRVSKPSVADKQVCLSPLAYFAYFAVQILCVSSVPFRGPTLLKPFCNGSGNGL